MIGISVNEFAWAAISTSRADALGDGVVKGMKLADVIEDGVRARGFAQPEAGRLMS
ncbi:hypothetical protein ACFSCV_10255 [Methylopila henanensis]|uniref:Uncharacterized protein n=1 Tax=Methylopila henanensis TaxID=873516 RepID=A0ABW4K5D8_9HYPH